MYQNELKTINRPSKSRDEIKWERAIARKIIRREAEPTFFEIELPGRFMEDRRLGKTRNP